MTYALGMAGWTGEIENALPFSLSVNRLSFPNQSPCATAHLAEHCSPLLGRAGRSEELQEVHEVHIVEACERSLQAKGQASYARAAREFSEVAPAHIPYWASSDNIGMRNCDSRGGERIPVSISIKEQPNLPMALILRESLSRIMVFDAGFWTKTLALLGYKPKLRI